MNTSTVKNMLLIAALAVSSSIYAQDRMPATALIETANRVQHTGTAYTELNPPHEVGSAAWGPIIGFTGPRPDAPSPYLFGLNLNGVPTSDCLALLTEVSERFVDVWVADAGPEATGASVYTRGHLDPAKARAACAAHERLGIDFISR